MKDVYVFGSREGDGGSISQREKGFKLERETNADNIFDNPLQISFPLILRVVLLEVHSRR